MEKQSVNFTMFYPSGWIGMDIESHYHKFMTRRGYLLLGKGGELKQVIDKINILGTERLTFHYEFTIEDIGVFH